MKVRNGFVSNSSSSSFMIAVKGEERPTVQAVLEALGVAQDAPGIKFFTKLAKSMVECATCGCSASVCRTAEEFEDNFYSNEEVDVTKMVEDGFVFYVGSACDESSDGVEQMLCHTAIDVRAENVVIIGSGDY